MRLTTDGGSSSVLEIATVSARTDARADETDITVPTIGMSVPRTVPPGCGAGTQAPTTR